MKGFTQKTQKTLDKKHITWAMKRVRNNKTLGYRFVLRHTTKTCQHTVTRFYGDASVQKIGMDNILLDGMHKLQENMKK